MGLRCLLGHDWDACTCKRCQATRDHDWNGCLCRRCGKKRDESHDWNGCTCRRCSKTRNEEHKWYRCTCSHCGATREHAWDSCRCRRCSTQRDEGHDWDRCRCRVCGKTRDESHDWEGCTCRVCRKTRDDGHDWDRCKCRRCGAPGEHTWRGCKCVRCQRIRYEMHDWSSGRECHVCGDLEWHALIGMELDAPEGARILGLAGAGGVLRGEAVQRRDFGSYVHRSPSRGLTVRINQNIQICWIDLFDQDPSNPEWRRFNGKLPCGLQFGMTRQEVEERLGSPWGAGGGQRFDASYRLHDKRELRIFYRTEDGKDMNATFNCVRVENSGALGML